MDLSLLKRMATEVSDETLSELLTQAVGGFTADDTDKLRQIDVIVSELKRRHGIVDEVQPKKDSGRKRDYKAEAERKKAKQAAETKTEVKAVVTDENGSLRKESGKLQSGESGATRPLTLGGASV